MPSLLYPYNYTDRDDPCALWAAAREAEMRKARRRAQEELSLVAATAKASRTMRRLAIAIGGPDV